MEGLELVTNHIINNEIYGNNYPCWIRKLIKRKYGNNPEVYIDVWIPYRKSLFDFLPKKSWSGDLVRVEDAKQ
jgi:hypothetical protein